MPQFALTQTVDITQGHAIIAMSARLLETRLRHIDPWLQQNLWHHIDSWLQRGPAH